MEQLSESQLAFMRVLWRKPGATVNEVKAALETDGRCLAQTTVATVLGRLEKKGLVHHEVSGRQYFYEAAVSEHQVRTSVLERVTEGLFGGDPSALICQLLDQGGVGPSELAQVRALIEAREQATSTPGDDAGKGDDT